MVISFYPRSNTGIFYIQIVSMSSCAENHVRLLQYKNILNLELLL